HADGKLVGALLDLVRREARSEMRNGYVDDEAGSGIPARRRHLTGGRIEDPQARAAPRRAVAAPRSLPRLWHVVDKRLPGPTGLAAIKLKREIVHTRLGVRVVGVDGNRHRDPGLERDSGVDV